MPALSRAGRFGLITTLLAALTTSFTAPPAVAATEGRAAGHPQAPADHDTCPYRELPPPPVDTSEEPEPGEPSPTPLPVPETPAGGEQMARCGTVLPEQAPPLPGPLTPKSWVLADVDNGTVLAARDPHGRYRPASLVKMLLALVVIEETAPQDTVRVTKADANQEGSSVGIIPGRSYTVDLLLHGLLLRSGNDVAHALARHLGGVPTALRKMNTLADKLGAQDTRAATPSGLDGPGMTTSAYDLALVARAAMDEPQFVDTVQTRSVRFPGKGGKPGYMVYNDNKLLGSYAGFIGGKTGFTDDARHTYAGIAERQGTRVAVIMLRGEQRPIRMADQAQLLLDYGFRLAGSQSEPVGSLVEPAAEESRTARPAAGGDQDSTSGGDGKRTLFGNVGGPLLALFGLVAALSGFQWLRRKWRGNGQTAG